MIDLLANSCKASGLLTTSFTNEELVQFWLGDILPLLFDSDRNIQNCAIAALAEALVALDVAVIHAAKCWPQIRTEFVNNYTTQISAMRDTKNNNWHKIWTLLVQIMDNELLRGCTNINKFLAVVELGFRNPDNGVRSEAFLCWRVLIKIFAAYNELTAGKRLRLLLIPLRTSQSRSAHVSSIKLRVWWYLISCLDVDMPKSFDTAIECFLSFLFGGGSRNTATGLANTYQAARELALPCLVALWNVESNSASLQRILREQRLEPLSQPSSLMTAEMLQLHWRPMLAAAVSGMQLLSQQENSTETEQELLHLLLRNLTLAMLQLRVEPFIVACCAELQKTLATDGRVVRSFFNTYAAASPVTPPQRVISLDVLEAYMKLCLKSRSEVPPAILQRCIATIYNPEQLEAHSTNEFRLLSSFAELLMAPNDEAEDDYEGFGVKLHIWRQVSTALLSYLRENALEYRVAHNATLLDKWILWPLQTCAGFAGRRANSSFFDGTFSEQWRQLISAGHNATERKKFVVELKQALMDVLKNSTKEEPLFAELFDAYVSAVLKLGICKDTPLYRDVFALLQALYECPTVSQSLLEGCLNTLRNLILELRQNELMVIFDALKPTLVGALQCWKKLKCEGSFLKEWKRTIQERFRKLFSKNMASQLKDLFKDDDLFVIIPSVWSLNPEKLTDRQKERFAEKSDIPALYNDMSQSQDSSIKPWTPKKVVIAKGKQVEIAIGGEKEHNNDDIMVIDESPPVEVSATPATVAATPTRRRQLATAEAAANTDSSGNADKYKFRKTRTQTETEESKTTPATAGEDTPARLTRQRTAQKESAAVPAVLRSPRKQTTTTAAATTATPQVTAGKNSSSITLRILFYLLAFFPQPNPPHRSSRRLQNPPLCRVRICSLNWQRQTQRQHQLSSSNSSLNRLRKHQVCRKHS